jgi:hypothetical protein
MSALLLHLLTSHGWHVWREWHWYYAQHARGGWTEWYAGRGKLHCVVQHVGTVANLNRCWR